MKLFRERKLRLYCETDLKKLQEMKDLFLLSAEQTHYVIDVMRRKVGGVIFLIDGVHGEYVAEIISMHSKKVFVRVLEKVENLKIPPDLWLLFPPLKKVRTDFIVEKATELGVRKIKLVLTQYTNVEKVKLDKLHLKIISAIQQCGGTYLPELIEPVKLLDLINNWPTNRQLVYCDERMNDVSIQDSLSKFGSPTAAILIGPEGGFSDKESEAIRSIDSTLPVSLGSRILRADTASISAIAVWHSICGDWRG